MLVSTQTRDAIAEGILAAVKRLYLLGKNDRPTGTFTFAELLAHELAVERAGRLGGSWPISPPATSSGRRPGSTGCLQLRALQQPLQSGLDFGLPAQALVQLQAQPREVRMRSDHNEARVLQEVGVDDAMLDRAVTEGTSTPGAQSGVDQPRVLQFRGRLRAAERLQRAHPAPDQLVDHPRR